MNKLFYFFRYVSLVAIVSSLLGSALMFIIGAKTTYYAYATYFFGYSPTGDLENLKSSHVATVFLVKSIDAFLIGLVLFIFAYGVYWVFIAQDTKTGGTDPLKSIRITNIGHLKNILAEVIIIILFVLFLETELKNINNPTWEMLVIPISILLLSLGLKFLDLRHDTKEKEQVE